MKEICTLVERAMYCKPKEMEKIYEKWASELEDRADMMIGQTMMALHELDKKKK